MVLGRLGSITRSAPGGSTILIVGGVGRAECRPSRAGVAPRDRAVAAGDRADRDRRAGAQRRRGGQPDLQRPPRAAQPLRLADDLVGLFLAHLMPLSRRAAARARSASAWACSSARRAPSSIASSSQSTFAGHAFGGVLVERLQAVAGDHRDDRLVGREAPGRGELLEHGDRRAAGRLGQQALGGGEQVDAGEDLRV